MFKPVQQWIKSARTQLVSVPAKFLDEPQTKNGLPRRVVKNMKSDQAAVKILVSSIVDFTDFTIFTLPYFVIEIGYNRSLTIVKMSSSRFS